MTSLDDKILGVKVHNYCSSSEDEGGSDDERSGDEEGEMASATPAAAEPAINSWSGTATNTGPKGVIEDWRRFKQLEAENRKEMEKERIALAKKYTLSTRTESEEAQAKENEKIEDEMKELLDEDFLMEYQKKRMQELMGQLQKVLTFGKVITLHNQDEFLDAIDNENKSVTVIIHIYNDKTLACETMDGCLNVLAQEYAAIKFCRISAHVTGLSKHFRVEGVPALLAYKGGQIIGNFVQLATELGNDFYANDVERHLIEYGLLPEK